MLFFSKTSGTSGLRISAQISPAEALKMGADVDEKPGYLESLVPPNLIPHGRDSL